MRAIVDGRVAGIPVIGLIGGRAGCYGGGGLIAGTCSRLAVSEGGRISVSGPEVIETNKGAEEFDSRDRALVWRTMGGKHRRLIGGADAFCADTGWSFRAAARDLVGRQRAARDLDHRADQVVQLALLLGHDFLGHAVHHFDLQVEFLLEADERDHHFGMHFDALGLHDRRRFEYRARLHRGDLRVVDAQATPAQAQHRVELVELADALFDRRRRAGVGSHPGARALRRAARR